MLLNPYDVDEFVCPGTILKPETEIMLGVVWGEVSMPFSPAFWSHYCISTNAINDISAYHLGDTLREEVAACILGGHGISGELGNAAYRHIQELGIITKRDVTQAEIEGALYCPLRVNGRLIKYRFPRQKAKFLSAALNFLDRHEPPSDSAVELRDWLIQIPGIGMKTASWIVRNWLDAEDVAILDIHIHRAGVIAGFYNANDDVTKSYKDMERKFVEFSSCIGIPANVLDNQIWNELRVTPSLVRNMLQEKGVSAEDKCGLPTDNVRKAQMNMDLFAAL